MCTRRCLHSSCSTRTMLSRVPVRSTPFDTASKRRTVTSSSARATRPSGSSRTGSSPGAECDSHTGSLASGSRRLLSRVSRCICSIAPSACRRICLCSSGGSEQAPRRGSTTSAPSSRTAATSSSEGLARTQPHPPPPTATRPPTTNRRGRSAMRTWTRETCSARLDGGTRQSAEPAMSIRVRRKSFDGETKPRRRVTSG
mmetsp:Transcript_17315/g.41976  ORF Transcript_17315/g.41976 Transcript_17315/m.41976 type:complete len:200 (-) Transcript_17315:160-759(-)